MNTALPPLAVLLASTLLAACGGAEAAPDAAPIAEEVIAVRVAAVSGGTRAAPAVRAVGLVGARDEAQPGFLVGGVVTAVFVREGQAVRAGQPLATLDAGGADAAVAGALAGAEAAAAGEQTALAADEKAARDLARAETLFRDSVATLEQVQDAATGRRAAATQRAAAQASRNAAAAALAGARFQQRHATLYARTSGVVMQRLAEPGETVGPGTPVVVLSAGGGYAVRVGLAEAEAVRVRVGDGATVTLDAYPSRSFAGRVVEIAATASAGTGTYEVQIALSGASGVRLAPGLTARAEIAASGAGAQGVFYVPVEALIEGDADSASVFALAPDGRTARRVAVRLAFLDGARAAVTSAEPLRLVITDGVAYVTDDAGVRVVR